jgi:hypothetical protein
VVEVLFYSGDKGNRFWIRPPLIFYNSEHEIGYSGGFIPTYLRGEKEGVDFLIETSRRSYPDKKWNR